MTDSRSAGSPGYFSAGPPAGSGVSHRSSSLAGGRDSEPLAPFCAPALQDVPSRFGAHPAAKPVGSLPANSARLIRTLHGGGSLRECEDEGVLSVGGGRSWTPVSFVTRRAKVSAAFRLCQRRLSGGSPSRVRRCIVIRFFRSLGIRLPGQSGRSFRTRNSKWNQRVEVLMDILVALP